MNKRSVAPANTACPQTAFLVGTYKEDGTPNFGLFCWVTYCWDGNLSAVVSIGGGKLTRDRILAAGVFSANLVTEPLLPLADYFGSNSGYEPGKMDVGFRWTQGKELPVPVLADSPWSFELEVKHTVELDGGTVFVCAIRNVSADETMLAEGVGMDEKIPSIQPVLCMPGVYFSVGRQIGAWGQWKNLKNGK